MFSLGLGRLAHRALEGQMRPIGNHVSFRTGPVSLVRFDIGHRLIARPPVCVGQLPRRQFGHGGRFIGAPPGPDEAAEHEQQRDLKQQTEH